MKFFWLFLCSLIAVKNAAPTGETLPDDLDCEIKSIRAGSNMCNYNTNNPQSQPINIQQHAQVPEQHLNSINEDSALKKEQNLFFEGDMKLQKGYDSSNIYEYVNLVNEHMANPPALENRQSAAIRNPYKLWPGAEVPYVLSPKYN